MVTNDSTPTTIIIIVLCMLVTVLLIGLVVALIYLKRNKNNPNQDNQFINNQLQTLRDSMSDDLNKIDNKIFQVLESKLSDYKKDINVQWEQQSKIKEQINSLIDSKLNDYKTEINIQRSNQLKLNDDIQLMAKNFSEIKQKVFDIKEKSEKLTNLENKMQDVLNVFVNNKHRGNLGEFNLEQILIDTFGEDQKRWQKSYQTSLGVIDFIIFFDDQKMKIGIDAKFPLDNYQKIHKALDKESVNHYKKLFENDVKNKINELKKYQKDIENVVLYIPSENIFAFIQAEYIDLIRKSHNQKIWITGPTTLIAMITVIGRLDQSKQMENNLKSVIQNIEKIFEEYKRWNDRFDNVKDAFIKVNKTIGALDITKNKIYNKIEKMQKDKNKLIEFKDSTNNNSSSDLELDMTQDSKQELEDY